MKSLSVRAGKTERAPDDKLSISPYMGDSMKDVLRGIVVSAIRYRDPDVGAILQDELHGIVLERVQVELSQTVQDKVQEARGAYELEPSSLSKFWMHKVDLPSHKFSVKGKGDMGGLEFVHFLYTQTVGTHSSKNMKKFFSGKGLIQLPG